MMLTEKNYFSRRANKEYMSASQFKAFKKCEAAALAMVRGRYDIDITTPMLVGSYVDAYFTGEIDLFVAQHPELFKRDGTLKSEFAHAEYIIDRIQKQKTMRSLLNGEHQKIFTGEINGVKFKVKLDSYIPGKAIVDLKVMKDFSPIYVDGEGRLPWYQAWHYDTQGAIYREIVRQNTGETLPFILVAATKETEPDLCAIRVNDVLLNYELEQVKEYAPRFDAIKQGIIKPKRCEECTFCRRTKKVKLIDSEVIE